MQEWEGHMKYKQDWKNKISNKNCLTLPAYNLHGVAALISLINKCIFY